MLKYNPNERITAYEALNHDYFKDIDEKVNPYIKNSIQFNMNIKKETPTEFLKN